MRPVLFHLGPLPVYSFGFLVASGVALSLFLMARKARRTGFPPGDMVFDMVFAAVLSGFAGARLYYVLQNFDWYLRHPFEIFALWQGGLIFYGGMIASFLGLWGFLKFKKLSFRKGLDFILPFVALTHGFGRLGCFLNGCCHGKACDLPWAIKVPDRDYLVHPTQLYEAGFDFLLFIFLSRRYEKKAFDGEVAALYFIFYAAARFMIEFFREADAFWGFLTANQWISLGVMVLAGIYYYFQLRNSRRGSKFKV